MIIMTAKKREHLVQKTFSITVTDLDRLKDMAEETGRSESDIIREAIADKLDKWEGKQ